MRIANAAMSGALWAGGMMWSQTADAIRPKANPATPATTAPRRVAKKKRTRSNGNAAMCTSLWK
jgi:hypothetical protein